MKKKLFLLALVIFSVFAFTACGGSDNAKENANTNQQQTADNKKDDKTASDNKSSENSPSGASIDKIKEKGKLVIGTTADYPPYEFKIMQNGKLEIVGFDIEIAKLIAKKLGVELEIKDMDFKLLIEAVKKGEIDIALAGINPTEERKKEIGMTNVYYKANQTVLIRKEDESVYTSLDALKGKTLGAQMGATQVELAKTVENAQIKELPLITALIADLKTKKIDAIVLEEAVAKQYASTNDDLLVPNFLFESNDKGSAAGVKLENTDLLEFLNTTLGEMEKDGTIEKLVTEAIDLSNSAKQ